MKKFFLILTLSTAAGGTYFYLQSPPKFQGKYAAIHEDIWKYTREKSLKEKLEIATLLQMSSLLRQEDAGLSEEEKKVEAEAIQFLLDTAKRAEEFEAKLTAEDIAKITEANPQSLYRRVGFFRTSNFHQKCAPVEYQAIRRKVGFEGMVSKVSSVGPLVTVYEEEFRPSYYQHAIDLLRADGRFEEYRDLADGYYALQLDPPMKVSAEERNSWKSEYEGKLLAAGVPSGQVRSYVLDLASQAPACLGGINIEFVHEMEEDETQTRGQFLLERVKQFVRTTGKAPADIYEIPLNASDPIYGKPNDGWGFAYELARQGRVLVLSSKGRDGKGQIKIGEVPL